MSRAVSSGLQRYVLPSLEIADYFKSLRSTRANVLHRLDREKNDVYPTVMLESP